MSGMPQEGAIQGDDSVQARTSDGQVVFVDASVIFRIDPDQAVDVHIRWQNNYVDNLIRPQARGVIRDWVSQFGVEGVYSSNREELTLSIEEDLQTRLSDEGLELIDFVMRNITFSPEYAASVEQKQIAEQLAQQAVFVVEQRKQEAEQARQQAQGLADAAAIRAEGDARAILINAQADADARLLKAEAEAEALSMLAASIRQNPDVLTLEYIQRLSPNISVMLLPSENPLLLPLPSVEELGSSLGTSPLPTPLPSPSEGDTP
jgi:regulator of protease activity HflC (stomatin/prohibitin superfamily)